MKTLELRYVTLGVDEPVTDVKGPGFRKRALKRRQKEGVRSVAEDIFPKLVEHKGEMPVIKDRLPTIFRIEEEAQGKVQQGILDTLAGYRASLPSAYRSLFDRCERLPQPRPARREPLPAHAARKRHFSRAGPGSRA